VVSYARGLHALGAFLQLSLLRRRPSGGYAQLFLALVPPFQAIWVNPKFAGDDKSQQTTTPETKETPEKMTRSLHGIFCKGRYRSWELCRRP